MIESPTQASIGTSNQNHVANVSESAIPAPPPGALRRPRPVNPEAPLRVRDIRTFLFVQSRASFIRHFSFGLAPAMLRPSSLTFQAIFDCCPRGMLFAGLEEPRHVVTKAAVALFRAISGARVPPQANAPRGSERSPLMLATSPLAARAGR